MVSWSFAADAGGAAATSLVAGWLADRIPIRFLAAVSFSGFIVAILLMIYVSSPQMMFLSTTLFGSSVGFGMIVHSYIFAAYYGRAFLGAIRGIAMPVNLLSAGLGAPLVGYSARLHRLLRVGMVDAPHHIRRQRRPGVDGAAAPEASRS